MTQNLNNLRDINQFSNYVTHLRPTIGFWGGRYFESRTQPHFIKMNDIVKRFKVIFYQSRNIYDLSKKTYNCIRDLDHQADFKLNNQNFFVRHCTYLRQFFENILFNKEKTLANLKKAIESDIQGRLNKNLTASMRQQKKERDKAFVLDDSILPRKIQIINRKRPLNSQSLAVNRYRVGIASCQGYRSSMEDAEIAAEFSLKTCNNTYNVTLFAVFDGHSGNDASEFVKENMTDYLKEALETSNRNYLSTEGIWNALKKCCINLDKDYQGNSGTTVTLAMIIDDFLWVANVGDSRTILIHNNEVTQLSEDAKPEIERFKRGIYKLGGSVNSRSGRINDTLAVARAIGDKSITNRKGTSCVSPKPKITRYPLRHVQSGFLVLACDGLYDVASTNQVAKAIYELTNTQESTKNMAKRLVFSAIKSFSRDNVTVMVVRLPG